MTISGLKVGRSPNLIFHWELSHCGKTRISWAQSCCFLSFYRSPLLWGNSRDASNWIRPSVWRIHYFHIAHDALCPATFCINIASISPGYYSRPLQFLVWGEAGGWTWYIMGDEKMWNRELTYLKPIAVKRKRLHVYEVPISSELYLIWLKLPFYQWGHSAHINFLATWKTACISIDVGVYCCFIRLMLLKCARVCMRAKHKKKLLMLKARGTR